MLAKVVYSKAKLMRTFLLAFIALILLGNAGGAENLTRRAFTEAVAKAARTAMPSAKVSVAGDLQLEIEYGVGGGTATLADYDHRHCRLTTKTAWLLKYLSSLVNGPSEYCSSLPSAL